LTKSAIAAWATTLVDIENMNLWTEIVAGVQRVTEVIGEITTAAAEQSAGIAQINQAVSHLDEMTQQNAALVEESAAAAQSLNEQALRLSSTVGSFKLVDRAG